MAFRISHTGKNGNRLKSVLVNESTAIISSKSDAELQVELPADVSIKIEQMQGEFKLTADGAPITIAKQQNSEVKVRNSSDFSCCDQSFYLTSIIDETQTPRKKSLLSAFALTTVWSLLAIMIIVPIWLPYKITVHEQKDRNVLVDKCSKELDILRDVLKGSINKSDSYSQIHREILVSINDEVEQVAWVFRNAGDYMNQEKMIKLESDISKYLAVIKSLKKAEAITINSLNADKVINSLLMPK
jgi:hypothetical protein